MCGTAGRVAAGIATGGVSEGVRAIGNALPSPIPGGAPTLPQFPGLTQDEQDILKKEGVTLDQFNQIINGTGNSLAQNQNILKQISGLYDAQGNLDQAALADLKSRAQGQVAQSQGVGSAALGYLQNYFGGGGASGTGVAGAQSDAYLTALKGTGAVNAATTQKQARDFQTLKDSLAQRGIMVTGDTIDQATSDSTAGQRALQMFQQNVTAQNSSERLGYIQTLGSQMGGSINAAEGAVGTAGTGINNAFAAPNAALGYTTTAATQGANTLSPLLSQYQSGLNMQYQPYQTQQLGPYQQQLDQQSMNYTAGLNQANAWGNLYGGILNTVGTVGASAAKRGAA